ncbi:hypothetical protein SAMCCGM7_pC1319 (plasmid) [Sinorhizobium americanum CCGM7]|nr:hypothetical protein SAMCCGM7_pC1319 [Sinorhizobium americanum CCGM7]
MVMERARRLMGASCKSAGRAARLPKLSTTGNRAVFGIGRTDIDERVGQYSL